MDDKKQEHKPTGTHDCLKQVVIATIITPNGRRFVSSNYINNNPTSCPRGDLPSGVGYELCKSICNQSAHAEVNALKLAGSESKGSKLYFEGHSYACEPCKKAASEAGIIEIIISAPPVIENE